MFGSIALFGSTTAMTPDGKVVPPRNYKGSLEEKAQEAIIVFHSSKERGSAVEDLVIKISVQGSAKTFHWVVPFPTKPDVHREDPQLFSELFGYVKTRRYRSRKKGKNEGSKLSQGADAKPLEVLSRKIVGKFDVAVVRVNEEGAEDVRQWKDDLWMYPYYTDRNMVPHDVRPGGAAAGTCASPPKLGDR